MAGDGGNIHGSQKVRIQAKLRSNRVQSMSVSKAVQSGVATIKQITEEMKPLADGHHVKRVGNEEVKVTFTREYNKHLVTDMLGKVKDIPRSELPNLGKVFDEAKFHSRASHDKEQPKGKFVHEVLYFKGSIGGKPVYFNVRKEHSTSDRTGHIRYHVYALSSKMKKK